MNDGPQAVSLPTAVLLLDRQYGPGLPLHLAVIPSSRHRNSRLLHFYHLSSNDT